MLESSKYHLHLLYTSHIDYEKLLMLIDQWQSYPIICSTGQYHFPDQQEWRRWVLPSITGV